VAVTCAVFIDKDGTLVENVPYNVDPARVQLLPGVLDGLRALAHFGFRLFVVSNQPGVALGRFVPGALSMVEARLSALAAAAGLRFDGFAWCPHHPEGTVAPYAVQCGCRKPQPGMLRDLAHTHGVALEHSWMIGDILDDIEAGHRAGCRAVLVDRGGETEWRPGPHRVPDAVVHRFDAAARLIVGEGRGIDETHAAAPVSP
jgi:histidinol-phosphate phosphatase family protein